MMNVSKRLWAPIGLLLGGIAAPLLSLSGCGGGDNGVTVPPPVVLGTPTPAPPTPTPDPRITPTPTPFPPGTTFEPNYLSTIGSPSRWPSFPLKVYFDPASNPTPERRNILTTGFNQWVTATANRVRYTVITDPAQADVTVIFNTFVPGGDNILGLAELLIDSRGIITDARVTIALTGNNNEDTNTAAHEFGHTLGIIGDPGPPDRGHSPNVPDLMYFLGNSANLRGCSCVTTADRNTLFAIYNGQFPQATGARRPAPVGPLRTITISRSRDRGCVHHH